MDPDLISGVYDYAKQVIDVVMPLFAISSGFILGYALVEVASNWLTGRQDLEEKRFRHIESVVNKRADELMMLAVEMMLAIDGLDRLEGVGDRFDQICRRQEQEIQDLKLSLICLAILSELEGGDHEH
jgi:hypothetical protein